MANQYFFDKATDVLLDYSDTLNNIMAKIAEFTYEKAEIQFNSPIGKIIFTINGNDSKIKT